MWSSSIDFVNRRFSSMQNICNPRADASSVVYSEYLKQYDNNLFIFANKIANQVGRSAFPSVDEARAYLKNTENQAQIQGIRDLNLFGSDLEILPAEIRLFTGLQTLKVGGNQLTSLPAEIGRLTALQEFDVNYNQLTSLPAEIGRLTALRDLGVSGNQLTSLPVEMRNFFPNSIHGLRPYWTAWLAARSSF